MAGSSASKGNPASHRMSNPNRKTKYESAWKRSAATKQQRNEANLARKKANDKLRAEGKPTAWEVAEAKRAKRRGTPDRQPRTDRTNNILIEDGRVKPCCQAKSIVTRNGRIKCGHREQGVTDSDRYQPLRPLVDQRGI